MDPASLASDAPASSSPVPRSRAGGSRRRRSESSQTTDDSNGNGTEPRRSGRRRRVNNVAYEPDSFKEAELLQQALRASIIAAHSTKVNTIDDAPVFHPTEEEFRDPLAYIDSIRDDVEDEYGICKIVPPASWRPPVMFDDGKVETFPTRIQPIHRLQEGIGFDYADRRYTVSEYKRMADDFYRSHFGCEPGTMSSDTIEDHYWKIVKSGNQDVFVEYGNDVDSTSFGSGFPSRGPYATHPWNLNNIARLPRSVIGSLKSGISGVTVPWVYFGMLFSSFCWHTEDLWMYSINYNHFGAPKTWYGAPGCDHRKVEKAMRDQVPGLFKEEPDLAMQLVTQLLPSTLVAADVSICHAVQNAGEFIVTFPRAFHAGFNQGFNCCEAVNFATDDWLQHGRHAVEDCRRFGKHPVFPTDKLLLNVIERDAGHCDKEVLQHELKHLTKTHEDWRSYWNLRGVERWIRVPVHAEQDDETAVELCSLCNQWCYLSFMKCSCNPNRIVCLHHSNDAKGCKCPVPEMSAFYRYDVSDLTALAESLASR
ncbi:unnamed protein product (mitochondrion) [Plasmodiophora brassicae]|uniref:JmjC domain-containing protein n=1 Tax=Plasmodiophora brassicae TaxID=37360 RepID=A0A3P3YKI3_PLABS|nr:unnamed protein product [Plasmodiophora brassicae]